MTNKPLTRKLLAVLLAVVILVGAMLTTTATSNTITVWEGYIATGITKGTGTNEDPFIISNGAELAYAVNNSKADTYYKL